MPIIRINAIDNQALLHGSCRPVSAALDEVRSTQGPIIIMTHGYKYRPNDLNACPHQHILSLTPRTMQWYSPSWPQQLGFGAGFEDEGLAIAFGWDARGPIWTAHRNAVAAGRVLAQIISDLRHMFRDRPIHFIGHSMGIELALEALHNVQPGALNRIISMTGATYRTRALAALNTQTGRQAEFINVTSRENDLYDFLFERLIQPQEPGDRSIGCGLEAPNAVTMQIDCAATLGHLSELISPIGAPQRRVCHWSSYIRPGALRVYNALLRDPHGLNLDRLRRGLPGQTQRRWSRLFALPQSRQLLPFTQKAS